MYYFFFKFVYKITKVVIDLAFAFKPQGLGSEAFNIWKILGTSNKT